MLSGVLLNLRDKISEGSKDKTSKDVTNAIILEQLESKNIFFLHHEWGKMLQIGQISSNTKTFLAKLI